MLGLRLTRNNFTCDLFHRIPTTTPQIPLRRSARTRNPPGSMRNDHLSQTMVRTSNTPPTKPITKTTAQSSSLKARDRRPRPRHNPKRAANVTTAKSIVAPLAQRTPRHRPQTLDDPLSSTDSSTNPAITPGSGDGWPSTQSARSKSTLWERTTSPSSSELEAKEILRRAREVVKGDSTGIGRRPCIMDLILDSMSSSNSQDDGGSAEDDRDLDSENDSDADTTMMMSTWSMHDLYPRRSDVGHRRFRNRRYGGGEDGTRTSTATPLPRSWYCDQGETRSQTARTNHLLGTAEMWKRRRFSGLHEEGIDVDCSPTKIYHISAERSTAMWDPRLDGEGEAQQHFPMDTDAFDAGYATVDCGTIGGGGGGSHWNMPYACDHGHAYCASDHPYLTDYHSRIGFSPNCQCRRQWSATPTPTTVLSKSYYSYTSSSTSSSTSSGLGDTTMTFSEHLAYCDGGPKRWAC